MKIISKFHDYYDSAAAYGVSDVYWKRQGDITYREDPKLEDILANTRGWGGTPTIIMFCGKAFACVAMTSRGYTGIPYLITSSRDVLEYREMYEAGLIPPFGNVWPVFDAPERRFTPDASYTLRGFDAFVNDVAEIDTEPYHREYGTPIIHISQVGRSEDLSYQDRRGRYRNRVTMQTNPQLKPIGFHRLKDSFTAYQEIDSYLSGVLGVNVNPTVEISDTHRLEGHGFDKRTSFRNMKR